MLSLLADLILASLLLGLPLAGISWFLFSWLFNNGDLDRELSAEELKARIKKLKKSALNDEEGRSKTRFVYDKWMWFGSGFYGLAGLWTFAVIETLQFLSFVLNPGAWATFMNDGPIAFLIRFAFNQLENILQALIWFTYWPSDSMLLWVLVAFLGYRLGMHWARQGLELSAFKDWQERHALKLPLWGQKLLARMLGVSLADESSNLLRTDKDQRAEQGEKS